MTIRWIIKRLRSFGASLIAAGILISVFGALNGYLLTGVRVPFAMAQADLLPFSNIIGKVNPKHGTPTNALLFQGGLASIYALSGSFETLTNLAMFMVWLFFVLTVAGIFRLRKHHSDIKCDYKVPFYPIVPLIGIIGGGYVIISTLIGDFKGSIFGIAVTLAGLPIYYYRKRS